MRNGYMNTSLFDEQSLMLRARIHDLQEERRNVMEELQKEKELATLEQQYI